jgi:hypothetical protein
MNFVWIYRTRILGKTLEASDTKEEEKAKDSFVSTIYTEASTDINNQVPTA